MYPLAALICRITGPSFFISDNEELRPAISVMNCGEKKKMKAHLSLSLSLFCEIDEITFSTLFGTSFVDLRCVQLN